MEPRQYESLAIATPPDLPSSPSTGYPQGGIAGVIDATVPGPYWFYQIGESLRRVIVNAGLTPDASDMDLFKNALLTLIGNAFIGRPDPLITVNKANTAISDVIPFDNTVPQISEGQQVLTRTWTPSKAGAKAVVSAHVWIQSTTNGVAASAALFKDNACIEAGYCPGQTGANLDYAIKIILGGLVNIVTAPDTTPIVFSVRAGTSNSTYPVTLNGSQDIFGAAMGSYLSITEL